MTNERVGMNSGNGNGYPPMGDTHEADLPGQGELFAIPRPLGQNGPDKLIESDQTANVLARTRVTERQLYLFARVIRRKHSVLYGNSDMEAVYQFIMQLAPSIDGESRKQYIEAYKAQGGNMMRRGLFGRAVNAGREPQGGFQ